MLETGGPSADALQDPITDMNAADAGEREEDDGVDPGWIEAKKDALSQAQTGEWKLTLKLVDDDLEEWVRRAPMGTRFYIIMVDADTYDAQADEV